MGKFFRDLAGLVLVAAAGLVTVVVFEWWGFGPSVVAFVGWLVLGVVVGIVVSRG